MKHNNRLFFLLVTAFLSFVSFSLELRAQEQSFDDLLNQQLNPPENDFFYFDQSTDQESGVIDPNFLKEETKSFEEYTKVVIRILDKITAKSQTYTLHTGKTVAYGGLRIQPKVCKKTSPIDEPETASFLQIWERHKNGEGTWIFSGWMFASSPSLSAMEHPVYDVWVIDCVNDTLHSDSMTPGQN